MASAGSHCILEMYDCPPGLLNDAGIIRDALREAARVAGATLLHEVQHAFEPQGVTALALLAESHISLHTWPEHGYVAADVFTCGEHTLPEQACHYLVRTLQARRHQLRKLPRGTLVPQVRREQRVPVSIEAGAELAGEASEDPFRCQVRSFAQISG